jgi:16S rRNA processing protein RimM
MISMYQIGKITNTHGIKGEVKIYNLSDFNRFLVNEDIFVINKGIRKYFTIERVRPQGSLLIVKLKGYDDINLVLPFKGLDVYTEKSPDDELEEDDYHYQDLLEKEVYTEQGEHIGKVISLIPVPQGHLLEILKQDGTKALVPFVKAFVLEVKPDKIVIQPIEGLL